MGVPWYHARVVGDVGDTGIMGHVGLSGRTEVANRALEQSVGFQNSGHVAHNHMVRNNVGSTHAGTNQVEDNTADGDLHVTGTRIRN